MRIEITAGKNSERHSLYEKNFNIPAVLNFSRRDHTKDNRPYGCSLSPQLAGCFFKFNLREENFYGTKWK